jgi:hypothetical protein
LGLLDGEDDAELAKKVIEKPKKQKILSPQGMPCVFPFATVFYTRAYLVELKCSVLAFLKGEHVLFVGSEISYGAHESDRSFRCDYSSVGRKAPSW